MSDQPTSRRLAVRRTRVLGATLAILVTVAAAAFAAADTAKAAGARGLAPPGSVVAALKPVKMDSALDELARVTSAEGLSAGRVFAEDRGLDLKPAGVRVVIVTRDARPGTLAAVRRAVREHGGSVLAEYRDMAVARVPVTHLKALSRAATVLDLRQPGGCTADVITSEGVAEMAADVWNAAGFTGAGVKVGIIDTGFKGYPALLGTELPSQVTTWGQSTVGPEGGAGDGESVHGAGVAEVVHDVAPAAQLYLALVDNPVELGLAEEWMVSQGVDVINHSVGWWGWGQTDGTGVINDPVNDATSRNVFWANSAGNSRLMHWMGDFTDPNGNFWLDFDNVAGHQYNTFYASAGKYIQACLWWDDSFTAATEDFDLHLYSYNTSTDTFTHVASSMRRQRGVAGQTPVEVIQYTAPAAGYYAWAVARDWSVRTDVDFDLWSSQVRFDQPENPYPHYFMYERSFSQPADNASAGFMAVAAVERAPAFAQASYSSQGPTRDGRITPEISGPTAVSCVTYPTTFTGTSSASPHVAGLAAIIRQAYPSCNAAYVELLIRQTPRISVPPARTTRTAGVAPSSRHCRATPSDPRRRPGRRASSGAAPRRSAIR